MPICTTEEAIEEIRNGRMIILDDDDDMGLLSPWLVRTGFELGLQREHVEQAVALLERDREDALRLAVYDQRRRGR